LEINTVRGREEVEEGGGKGCKVIQWNEEEEERQACPHSMFGVQTRERRKGRVGGEEVLD